MEVSPLHGATVLRLPIVKHFGARLQRVYQIHSGKQTVPETEWRGFSRLLHARIELLVEAGIARELAEMYCFEQLKSGKVSPSWKGRQI
jgi:hypothetical protein